MAQIFARLRGEDKGGIGLYDKAIESNYPFGIPVCISFERLYGEENGRGERAGRRR